MRQSVCTRIPISKKETAEKFAVSLFICVPLHIGGKRAQNGLSVCLNSRHIKLNAKGKTWMTLVLQTAVGLAIPFVGTPPVALFGIYDLPVCGYARLVRCAHSIV